MAEAFSNSLTRAAGIVTTSSSGSIGITTNRLREFQQQQLQLAI